MSRPAHADALDRLAEGAPIYASARPIALVGALQRAGIADLPSVRQLRQQLGGIDPFNPAILAAPGIDVAAPLAGALFEPAGQGKLYHHRLAATLRDAATFTTFVSAVAASGQLRDLTRVDPGSPLGKQGVLATAHPSPDLSLALRLTGNDVVLDALQSVDDRGKAPPPAELLRRYPLVPGRPFVAGKGARKLFAPESAAVVYVDGRRIGGLIATVHADDVRRAMMMLDPGARTRVQAEEHKRDQRCAQLWDRAPTTFDDVALALSAAPERIGVTLAWGTQSGAPLGGLKLAPVDDGGIDAIELGRDSAAVIALYAASLAPFASLRRPGVFAGTDALVSGLKGCESSAGATLFVRSWPLALGAFAAQPPPQAAAFKPILQGLRTMVLALRDLPASASHLRFAAGYTFDNSARALVDAFLAAKSEAHQGAQQTIGKRSALVYQVPVAGMGIEATAGVGALGNDRFELAVADSEESLGWAYRAGDAAAARPPILRLGADLVAVSKWGQQMRLWREGDADFLAQLRRVDGELVADGDVLRLDLHAPLKH